MQKTALTEPNTIIISRRMAEKYFPEGEAVGKVLTLGNQWDNKVTAVFEDLPPNSHFQYDFFLSMESRDEAKQPMWVSHNFATYFVLKEGADVAALDAKFPAMIEKYAGPQIKQFLNMDMKGFEENGNRIRYFTQALLDIHLHSDFNFDFGSNGDINNVYLFSVIALFILLLACINFMNLSTARSANRAKEVGVRKVLGSHRKYLVGQFLMESILLSGVAFVLAMFLAELFIPMFNEMADKALSIPYSSAWFIPLLLICSILVGLLAGVYPAFYLSAFRPVEVLKGKLSLGSGSKRLRSSLVVFQFIASIILIIGTMIVFQQMQFIQTTQLGFNKDQLIVLDETWVLGDKAQTFKEAGT